MSGALLIRDVTPADRDAWFRLWAAYNAFYEASVAPQVSERTWQRMLDENAPLFGRVAEVEGRVVGFCLCVLHEGTWVETPICYLEDLFVDPAYRGRGIGRRLIEDLIALARSRGWSRLYWHTRESNPARKLYDEFATADDFVRYRLQF
ncbi:GNAT family N-acetyltransferase [Paraburkholderia lycopersici]|uniref:Acetyltransferase (GNAT) family protein n=1 Tax=Paraburkholderia lycopersici TaxID=416944 RepID=A0A1G6HC03_9BURK|nr:GNAT family N-acetyltransferase [Paraburkholderia lycopersici]SDB91799.1 Acetyltransferase (GNAT) family protein [Paraburkholderia lycopersici]